MAHVGAAPPLNGHGGSVALDRHAVMVARPAGEEQNPHLATAGFWFMLRGEHDPETLRWRGAWSSVKPEGAAATLCEATLVRTIGGDAHFD